MMTHVKTKKIWRLQHTNVDFRNVNESRTMRCAWTLFSFWKVQTGGTFTVDVDDVSGSPCTVGCLGSSRGCGYNNSGLLSMSCVMTSMFLCVIAKGKDLGASIVILGVTSFLCFLFLCHTSTFAFNIIICNLFNVPFQYISYFLT